MSDGYIGAIIFVNCSIIEEISKNGSVQWAYELGRHTQKRYFVILGHDTKLYYHFLYLFNVERANFAFVRLDRWNDDIDGKLYLNRVDSNCVVWKITDRVIL